MQKRELVLRRAGTWFWYVKSVEEIEKIQARDREAGRFLDAAGESLLYSSIGTGMFEDDTLVTITRRRGVPWPHWTRKPAYLAEGLATIAGVPRLVMVKTR